MSRDGNETDAYQQFGGPAEISGSNPMLSETTEQKSFTQFMQERNNFPVFYQRDGELRQVKTEIGNLPEELNPIGQEGLVFDSESAQKNKSDLELSEKIKSTRENLIDTTLLESPISDLTKQNIKDMGFPSFVSEALDKVKTTPAFSRLTTDKFFR